MPCYFPVTGRRGPGGVVFGGRFYKDRPPITIPCGRCIGCRLERARQWAVRIEHEATLHEACSFVTLTYNDDHLPPDRSLCVRDVQLFFKRLRKRLAKDDVVIRYVCSGEYGEQFSRPHYHAIIFGFDFRCDSWELEPSASGFPQWTNQLLLDAWRNGFATVSDVTFESAAYVASYTLEKVTGEKAEAHYGGRKPEFLLCSRGGRSGERGIAAEWFDRFKEVVWRDDAVVARGLKMRPPRSYDVLTKAARPDLWLEVRKAREVRASAVPPSEREHRRLATRERVKRSLIKSKGRNKWT